MGAICRRHLRPGVSQVGRLWGAHAILCLCQASSSGPSWTLCMLPSRQRAYLPPSPAPKARRSRASGVPGQASDPGSLQWEAWPHSQWVEPCPTDTCSLSASQQGKVPGLVSKLDQQCQPRIWPRRCLLSPRAPLREIRMAKNSGPRSWHWG